MAVYIGASGGRFSEYKLGYAFHIGNDYLDNIDDPFTRMYDDWALVELSKPVTKTYSYLGIYPVSGSNAMQSRTYYTQGYPVDLNGDIEPWNNYVMYRASGRILTTKTHDHFLPIVTTDIDYWEGQSGSPVYSYRTGYGYCTEAIIVSSYMDLSVMENYLICITNWLHNYILENCY